eukprot:COSAG06_NODE_42372_length_382_cov_0.858657_1_plen_23_part_10
MGRSNVAQSNSGTNLRAARRAAS